MPKPISPNAARAAEVASSPDWARLRIHDVARLLACSENTVRRRIQSGKIPAPSKEGGVLVWRVGDLRRALA
ncbi:helix-turn-helix domain-containing protein [Burkholderia cenocepacia]|uniref:helix-turn-helix transcriptional regulator n=1 Tax=Burkholderia cenocepacia TaxID=95486 RepID=UPI0028602844|nr:helix-turn-helix domain-containing protein [Burkholderia cenocepacia]MDR8077621.1 helix-turn-helix domain-containing protein [Burkholderia cenocepacia]